MYTQTSLSTQETKSENPIDDDNKTEWATSGDGDGGFIVLNLGARQDVAGVEFLTRSMLDGSAATEMYTVTIGDEMLAPADS